MGLINLTTNLKGLGFGDDRYKGGSSNEPYIKTQIPATDEPLQTGFTLSSGGLETIGLIAASAGAGAAIGAIGGSALGGAAAAGALIGAVAGAGIGIAGASLTSTSGNPSSFKAPSAGTGGPDFLLRGGTLLPNRIVRDVERIGNLIIDTKSAKGFLFVTKQNLLSRVAVKTEGTQGALLNDGIYLPTSTLASVAGVALGGYFNKQGINPFSGIGESYVPEKYYDIVKTQLTENITLSNRLFNLFEVKINNDSDFNTSNFTLFNANIINTEDSVNLLTYRGGPGATLGIGNTNIKLIDGFQRTGKNNIYGNEIVEKTYQTNFFNASQRIVPTREENNAKFKIVSVQKEFTANYKKFLDTLKSSIANGGIDPDPSRNNYSPDNTIPYSPTISGYGPGGIGQFGEEGNKAILLSENEVVADAGSSNDRIVESEQTGRKNIESDKYKNLSIKAPKNNDIIDFYISFANRNNFCYFPAYIESFNDGFTSDWKTEKFLGRAENFYTYSGFDRAISLTFKTYARNIDALSGMYSTLNTVVSSLAPTYNNGFMNGNIAKLTLGNYIVDLPGIITNFKFDQIISDNSTWDIDAQLPYLFNVSMDFKVIHNFVPSFGSIMFGNNYDITTHPYIKVNNIEE